MSSWIKQVVCIVTILYASVCHANTVYKISHFSDDYHATVTLIDGDRDAQESGYLSQEGYVSVYNKKGKRIIKGATGHLTLDVDEQQQVMPNVLELPYGTQSVLIFDDFNFDGTKDLALMDGQNSCYGGPSFQVYLGRANGFVHDVDLTDLAENYCGMFNWSAQDKQISTMTKSGCCWHEFNTYAYIKRKLTLTKSVIESLLNGPTHLMSYTSKVRTGANQYKTEVWHELMIEDEPTSKNIIMRMNLAPKTANAAQEQESKETQEPLPEVLTLYRSDYGQLDYLLTDAHNRVAYSYLLDAEGGLQRKRTFEPSFTYYQAQDTLDFSTPEALYRISDNAEQTGITVMTKSKSGKQLYRAGRSESKQGGLSALTQKQENGDVNESNVLVMP